jgi:hypothetical protein
MGIPQENTAQVPYVRHVITLYLLFCLVEGPKDGLVQSETCSQRQQKKNMLCFDCWFVGFLYYEFKLLQYTLPSRWGTNLFLCRYAMFSRT